MEIQSCIKRLESLTNHIERLGGHIEGSPYAEDVEALKEVTSLLVEQNTMPILTDINTAVLEVMKIALEKTQTTKAVVFVDYAAHVNQLKCRVHATGWKSGDDADFEKGVYVKPTERIPEGEIIQNLREVYMYIWELE